MIAHLLSLFPITAAVSDRGHLTLGGCDTVDLAREFGTPLYVFDVATLRAQCRAHLSAFSARYPDVRVAYAGKALLCIRLLRLLHEEGFYLDVVSGGELHVAKAAGFPPERVYFHGNNKGEHELTMALRQRVGRIVVDNVQELGMLASMTQGKATPAPILLRLAPAVDPHTHRYVATGVADSKFGLPIAGGQAAEAVRQALSAASLRLMGYHAHIGSQIHDVEPYRQTAEVLLGFAGEVRDRLGYIPGELSLGGGWAVRYVPDEDAPQPAQVAEAMTEAVKRRCRELGLPLPTLIVEPGRAVVAQAGVALYTVGASKDVPGVRRFVFVDGGMADNIRPALYGARYTAVAANRVTDQPAEVVTLAGRYCEAGDILVHETSLPRLVPGDLVAVASCGAYSLAMASNYNLALRPAIVGVAEGSATLWRRRETYRDLLRYDV